MCVMGEVMCVMGEGDVYDGRGGEVCTPLPKVSQELPTEVTQAKQQVIQQQKDAENTKLEFVKKLHKASGLCMFVCVGCV